MILRFVSKRSILLINSIVQSEFGGYFCPPHNLQNEPALDYVLAAIESPIFGRDLSPGLFEKAAALMCAIIKQHVFFDGNKRTGIEAARLLLAKNNFTLKTDPVDSDFVIKVSTGEVDRAALAEWLRVKSTALRRGGG